MQGAVQNVIFFYLVSFIVIASAFCAIFLPKIKYSLICLLIFVLGIVFLFFALNSVFCGVIEIIISGVLLILLLNYFSISSQKEKSGYSIIKYPRFWIVVFFISVLFCIGLKLIFYFADSGVFGEILSFKSLNLYPKIVSAVITVKSTVYDFFLSSVVMVGTILVSLTGILNLITKLNKKEENK